MSFKKNFIIVFCLLSLNLNAQTIISNTKINYTDSLGRKQGFWRKVYPNGNVAYEANFKNNKTIGEFKRYHENGKIKIYIKYDQEGKYGKTKIYDEDGVITGEGNYYGQLKDSIWRYYNNKTILISEEEFHQGKKDGFSKSYFENNQISEEIKWKDDIPDGIWRKYYETGEKYMETMVVKGLRNGLYYNYFKNGLPEVKGRYKNDKKEGIWEYYDFKGNMVKTIEYKNGVAKNQKEIDSLENLELKNLEKNKDKFIDPEKVKDNPGQIFKKQNSLDE